MTETILNKDTILVTVSDDHSFNCTVTALGRAGENNISQLEITIPQELTDFDAYLDFKKHKGETVRTERLNIEGDKIEYDIPLGLLDQNGNIEVQLILQDENGYVWKSTVKKFTVLKSINAVDDIPEKEDFITRAQKLLDELSKGATASGRVDSVELLANKWVGEASPYSQVVTIDGVTSTSKVDLNPTVEQLAIFHNKDLAFVTENDDGVVTVYAIGDKPANDYTMQVTITEVFV